MNTSSENQTHYARLYCDGASRGNPGPAGIGAVLFESGAKEACIEISEAIGQATNNVAEYTALIRGLEKSLEKKIKCLEILLDSELLVYQIRGNYRVKSPAMRPLYTQAKRLLTRLDAYAIRPIPREENWYADSLANQALDRLKKN